MVSKHAERCERCGESDCGHDVEGPPRVKTGTNTHTYPGVPTPSRRQCDTYLNAAPCCWHPTGAAFSTDPPLIEYVCCYCGYTKTESSRAKEELDGHGPHHPKRLDKRR
jgi:hypothetical protein